MNAKSAKIEKFRAQYRVADASDAPADVRMSKADNKRIDEWLAKRGDVTLSPWRRRRK